MSDLLPAINLSNSSIKLKIFAPFHISMKFVTIDVNIITNTQQVMPNSEMDFASNIMYAVTEANDTIDVDRK